MKEYTLVTTALEETWPEYNQPVLFLGEWCRLYSRRQRWENMDAEMVEYHWDDRDKLYEDFHYLCDLFDRLLIQLSSELNKVHGVDYTPRYWQILIGPWLMMFLPMIYDRWISVNTAISSFSITRTKVVDVDDYNFIPQSMEDFAYYSKSDLWNHVIYSLILKHLEFDSISTIKQPKDIAVKFPPTPCSSSKGIRSQIKDIISTVTSFIASNHSYFIFTPYLSLGNMFKLQLKLNQVPVIYQFEGCRDIGINLDFRTWDMSNFECKKEFENFALTVIPLQLPAVYLEGYNKVTEEIKKSRLPKKPKLIWTSNSYFMDDRFKLWAAEKVEDGGVPLLIGQHGGHYGQGKFSFTEYHELKISDHYLSWGWGGDEGNVIPIGCFKSPVKRKIQNLSPKSLLLMISGTSRYAGGLASMPIAGQWIKYMDDQIKFYRDLPSRISKNVTVRLYPNDYEWSQYNRWKDAFPESNVDDGKSNYNKLLERSSLIVSGWNSTTYLESMASDIPTIIFWTPEYFELRKDAMEDFNKLKEVGIYHDSPFSASAHIEKIWDEIDLWWKGANVISVKNNFIGKYAYPSNVVNKLNTVLRNISDDRGSLL
jgi:putative transferase (TIGR04331 family)